MPLESHLGTIDVLPDGAGALVIHSTEIIPNDAKPLLDAAIAGGVEGLKGYLEG